MASLVAGVDWPELVACLPGAGTGLQMEEPRGPTPAAKGGMVRSGWQVTKREQKSKDGMLTNYVFMEYLITDFQNIS